ncbi:MAG TPA: AAA family ATPase [Thermoguttaceae bacterium]
MLTRLRVRNFKRFDEIDVELGKSVVFIGPNNSGKTTALQALSLWDIGLRKWKEKKGGKASPEKRPGVTINRRDLITVPVPTANLLWRDLHVREGQQVEIEENGKTKKKQRTRNIRIDIIVDGFIHDKTWSCGLEFDYLNEESFACRPLRISGHEERPVEESEFSKIPEDLIRDNTSVIKVAYLPPMSGLADQEFLRQPGEIDFLLGQGQTAQVLRNLCYRIYEQGETRWGDVVKKVEPLFGVRLYPPEYIAERSEIILKYEENGSLLDLSCAGRGLQQTLLLLAHLYANPGTVLLLDEPDAHLEILRQKQTYQLITEVASEQDSQIIAASHSEVVLNEAAERDIVIAFVGKPHRIDDRGSQVAKSLKEIGFDQYYLAQERGWVLYLEGSTDLSILRAFADKLEHPAKKYLESPFTKYVGNDPRRVQSHFFGLREAKSDLAGIAIFDRLERDLPADLGAVGMTWKRKEIENYLCMPSILVAYAKDTCGGELFAASWCASMEEIIKDMIPPIAYRDPNNAWWFDTKVTDQFLDPLFERFFKEVGMPNLMQKTNYHVLTKYLKKNDIDPEIKEKLDAIVEVASQAKKFS